MTPVARSWSREVDGGGSAAPKGLQRLCRIRADIKLPARFGEASQYQLLCANCNWIKRDERGEVRGRKYSNR